MNDRQPTETKNLDGYGNPALPWSRPKDALEAKGKKNDTWFIGTTGPAGRPHAAGVGALWHEGALYFTSGDGTRKSRNLAANPAATISISLEGIDLVFEGPVERVTDRSTLEAVAGRYRDDGAGWPVKVDGDSFTAVQRSERRAASVAALSPPLREGLRRRNRGAERRYAVVVRPLSVPVIAAPPARA